jgi:hypothetical protein
MDDLAPETGEIDYEQLQEMAEYDLAAGAEEPAEVPPEAPAGDDYAEFEEEVLEPAEDVEQPDSEPDAGVEQDSTGEET